MGTHINITRKLDCSLVAQYMLHFGKDIETVIDKDIVTIEKQNFSHADGHLLFSLSFNYSAFFLIEQPKAFAEVFSIFLPASEESKAIFK